MAAPELQNAPAKPRPDESAIFATLGVLFEPTDVVELRAIAKGTRWITAGYFDGDHRAVLAKEAARLNARDAAVYVTLNELDPQVHSRCANRVAQTKVTVSDRDVKRRRLLLLDFDPLRPAETPATDTQVAAALERAVACEEFLTLQGWPPPLRALSGNGAHRLYPIDLPNTQVVTDLLKNVLIALADRFDDEVVKLDRSVFNAGRITKLYGSISTKGDHTPMAPWRLSTLQGSRSATVVSLYQLRALGPLPPPAEAGSPSPRSSSNEFDLEGFLARLAIPYTRDRHNGCDRYKFDYCAFIHEHGKGEAAVLRLPSGALVFKCMHDSCSGKKWDDLRALVDGPREAHEHQQVKPHAPVTNGNSQRPVMTPASDGQAVNAARPFQPLTAGEMLKRKTKQMLIENLIGLSEFVMLFGDAATAKTLTAIDLAVRAALGLPIMGHYPCATPLRVLYVTEEGVSGIPKRLGAALAHHGLSEGQPELENLRFMTCAPKLFHEDGAPEGIEAFLAEIRTLVEQGFTPDIVVLDTLADAAQGSEENSNKEAGIVLGRAKRIIDETGATIILLHHVGKVNGTYRGASAYRAKMDLMILIEGTENPRTVSCAKAKDLAPFPKQCFTVASDPYGFDSAIIEWDVPQAGTGEMKPGAATREEVLGVLRQHAAKYTSAMDVRQVSDAMSNPPTPPTIRKALNDLRDRGVVFGYQDKKVDGTGRLNKITWRYWATSGGEQ